MTRPSQPIKIIFFDIDETLYVKSKAYIPDSITQQVIPQLKEKGIIPAIATGRNFGGFPHALKPLMGEHGFELFVTINGQYNFYKDQMISQYGLTIEQIERCIEKLNALGIAYAFVTPEEIAVSEENPIVRAATAPIKSDYVVDPKFYLKSTAVQMLAFYPESRDEEICASGLLLDELKAVRWNPNAVDILRIENSKARGIEDVIRHFGLNIENTMAFGDGFNDIEMFDTVGFSVAMGNAEEELKQHADYITKHIEEDGILHALKEFKIL
ncbi:Cof-type HAD-IIB family hydrolase [Actinobacillus equuli subsp. equuli]|uniref:Cof-type HAD-IIB family hydrolase n=1 Tax=Actinobacillus equuli TaxID=718 RepID=UPI002418B91F|nr:Cof-type HAD-IIB family hydrolase [Actinobacillus equuli]MDG4953563.1 Cof-type HAD-IIB family hydrolase [Actinobacillus equuli subsp. equuli]WGE48691.1 Cof-type HAD-IIB family hydrolase [Actinobacillus equuli subsp. equuli]WGE55060.1 Cof-type HAD-IIB family hydrolase [Actinobacillus equuli subsp. equuli]WGE57140.1 Cof-type HAD-IIB family hydrolase [Actinobacillus equuli subsp. equuli]WGE83487.1 Cof-type HAD-IIB family hydrolase [Actinobacillus equuli subsp. equuli]